MILSNDEYNTLNKLANNSKMDCWFNLRYTDKQGDYVFDLENHKRMSLRQGVKQLIDGCIDLNIDELTDYEKFMLIRLLGELI